jgi:prepilin-type processing-associated H-X9-DG protein
MSDSKKVLLSFLLFSQDNQGQLPGNLEQVAQYLKGDPNHPDTQLTGTNDCEILCKGPLNAITNPASTIVIRDRQPWQAPNGTWVRSYGFADGHVEVPKNVDGNYDDWEKQHIIMTAPGAQ